MALTKGNLGESLIAATFGFASGALTAALPGASLAIDIGAGIAEDLFKQSYFYHTRGEEFSFGNKEVLINTGTALTANAIGNESALTESAVNNFVDATRKITPGNHPKVKKSAKKIIKNTFEQAGKDLGGATIGKTVWGGIKNVLGKIF